MSNPNQFVIKASQTIALLFRKYNITSFASMTKTAKDQFSQRDLEAYENALTILNDNGALG